MRKNLRDAPLRLLLFKKQKYQTIIRTLSREGLKKPIIHRTDLTDMKITTMVFRYRTGDYR